MLTDKYVISPLDGKQYCRKNGQFLRHIQQNGYQGYAHLFETLFPTCIQYCECGEKCLFVSSKMQYKQTCGSQICINRVISKNKQQRTEEELEDFREKFRHTMLQKTETEKSSIVEQRKTTGYKRGSYKKSVEKREITCEQRHGNKKYNNSQQISLTKQQWTEDRKEIFKQRLNLALGGKSLNDFQTEDMFIRRRKMLEERGDIVPLEQLTEWEQYKRRVRNLTEQNYRKFKTIINPTNLPRKRGEYELDHIVPIFYGFVNSIPEQVMASVENLQILPMSINRKKSNKHVSNSSN